MCISIPSVHSYEYTSFMIMHYKGSCSCNRWQVEIEVTRSLEEFNPRVCDCNYCQNNPSEIISNPNMIIEFVGGETSIIQNGDQLANFYYCDYCGDFLVVGCNLNGQLRGAVNSNLLHSSNQLGKPIQIQPRLLSSDEKLDRWGQVVGCIKWSIALSANEKNQNMNVNIRNTVGPWNKGFSLDQVI